MKFIVTQTSNWDRNDEIEINTLEELIDFAVKNKGSLIIEKPDFLNDNKWTLEIYDDYRE